MATNKMSADVNAFKKYLLEKEYQKKISAFNLQIAIKQTIIYGTLLVIA
jgi:hypothetical protein